MRYALSYDLADGASQKHGFRRAAGAGATVVYQRRQGRTDRSYVVDQSR